MALLNWLPTGDELVAEGPIPWPQPALLEGPEQIGLFLVDEGGRIRGRSRNSHTGALHLTVPAGGYLLSVEAWAPEEGLSGRIRHGIATEVLPDDLATLSDLILLDPVDSLPQTFLSALPSMRSSLELEADEPLVIGWEVFRVGLEAGGRLIRAELRQGRGGVLSEESAVGWASAAGRNRSSSPGANQAHPKSAPGSDRSEVTIPEVDSGDYVFRLRVTARGREELVRTLPIEIVP